MKTTDHIRILDWLSDGAWKCSTEMDFMRDARKKISELVKSGYNIEGIPCDGRCGTVHKSKNLKMRRLVIPFPQEQGLIGEPSLRMEAPISSQEAPVAPLTPEKVINHIQPLFVHTSILD